jgi:hypothetical protein
MAVNDLFRQQLKVINTGLASFKSNIEESGGQAIQLNWKPPVEVDPEAIRIIGKNRERIEEANKVVLDILLNSKPVLIGMGTALDQIPGMRKNLILHSGPPITWDRMCGPTRGAIIGALIYEGLASTVDEAEKLGSSGKIDYSPCHEHASVGPMAGIISSSMPVFIIKNEAYDNLAFCTLNEGLGKVLRYGAYGPEVIEKLTWMEEVMYPILRKAIEILGKIDLKYVIAQALQMGDEVHNRNRAATSLFYRAIAPAIVETCENKGDLVKVLNFINGNDHFFLNLSMPAAKACLDAAAKIPYSSIAVIMARNGTDFGIQLAGTGEKWFTGKSLVPDALFFPGFTKEDANPDIGDSAITETLGLGGFAIAAAPAIAQFVGGTASDAVRYTLDMYEITVGENKGYQIPYLNFRGVPTAIDVRKVIEKNMTPFIDTGVAHKNPGVGQVGAGVLSAPMEPFRKAYEGLAEELEKNKERKQKEK